MDGSISESPSLSLVPLHRKLVLLLDRINVWRDSRRYDGGVVDKHHDTDCASELVLPPPLPPPSPISKVFYSWIDRLNRMIDWKDVEIEDNKPLNSDLKHFEGPEKHLEIKFASVLNTESEREDSIAATNTTACESKSKMMKGCRQLTRAQLDEICTAAQCAILSTISNATMDAYVLSESSLFVYENAMIFKTCGATALLRCLTVVEQFVRTIGLTIATVRYSRANYSKPHLQPHPHAQFDDEIAFLNDLFGREGHAHVLGPSMKHHWVTFQIDNQSDIKVLLSSSDSSAMASNGGEHAERLVGELEIAGEDTKEASPGRSNSPFSAPNLRVLMHGLDEEHAKQFTKDFGYSSRDMSEKLCVDRLLEREMQVDDWAFDPCGYSMNAISEDSSYATVHITPESHCSYASFETNAHVRDYTSLVHKVLERFEPSRFMVILQVSQESDLEQWINSPFVKEMSLDTYQRQSVRIARFQHSEDACVMCDWSR